MLKPSWILPLALAVLSVSAISGCSGKANSAQAQDGNEADAARIPNSSPVLQLARRGDLEGLRAVLEADPKLVNAKGEQGQTPLHLAAAGGHRDLVDFLLEYGANPRATNDNSDTPSDIAQLAGHRDIMKTLMNAPAKPGR
ncbi:MAG: ankyrin repeat domain-containing protein [Candidatus Hydrogenedentes bacterium]|nr:ankyrin repeat domain-containing protein [Candidatus Hydrogenedentota bacterium]